jgi:hypothetical protein
LSAARAAVLASAAPADITHIDQLFSARRSVTRLIAILRTFEQPGCFWISANARSCKSCIESRVFAMQVRVLLYAGSRPRALPRWVQIALKPATKTLGLQGGIIRGKGRKYVMADSAFKRMQVDACACWFDTSKHHRGVAPRTSRALNCHEWNDGRQRLRLGHDASLKQAGAQHSLSPEMPGRRSGDCQNIRRQGSQTRVNSRTDGRKVSISRHSGGAGSCRRPSCLIDRARVCVGPNAFPWVTDRIRARRVGLEPSSHHANPSVSHVCWSLRVKRRSVA